MTDDIDAPRFPIAVAARAALMEEPALSMWFTRGSVDLRAREGGRPVAHVPGRIRAPRLLTLRACLTLSAAAELVRKGVSAADAYQAAKSWTWLGEGVSAVGGEVEDAPRRDPAGLFPSPYWTVLVHYSGPQAQVIAAENTSAGLALPFGDLFKPGMFWPGPGRYLSPTLVLLNHIDHRVRTTCADWIREREEAREALKARARAKDRERKAREYARKRAQAQGDPSR